jgi:hypothetical protein
LNPSFVSQRETIRNNKKESETIRNNQKQSETMVSRRGTIKRLAVKIEDFKCMLLKSLQDKEGGSWSMRRLVWAFLLVKILTGF